MRKVLIMCDSKRALQWIEARTTKSPALTRAIGALVRKVEECGFPVEFRWVPGNSVPGNKLADRLSRDAANDLRARKVAKGYEAHGGAYFIWPVRNKGLVQKATVECARLGKTRSESRSIVQLGGQQ